MATTNVSADSAKDKVETPWCAAYPAPSCSAVSVSCFEVLEWFRNGKRVGVDFILVDLRRTDHEVPYFLELKGA